MKRIYLLVLSALFLFSSGLYAQTDTSKIETGLLTGSISDDSTVHIYRGIPYSAPPVGELRWKAPEPPASWQGVYHTTDFAPTCMQIPPEKGSFYHVEFFEEPEPMSEDCLYLNVWTSANKSPNNRPVMMWIHGGAFSQGSGSMPTFNGENFAQKGVVLVTINYRLGIFGLLAHPELTNQSEYQSSGNYGLLDQVAALKWIQENISAFGGDPHNVTVIGQSSGAGNINKLMASPLTKGLFHRAILQSGSAYTFGETQTLEQAEQNGKEVTGQLGVTSVDELLEWSASKLLENGSEFSFRPNIDGWFLPDDEFAIFEEHKQHDIPVLAGSNADEGSTFFGPRLNAEIYKNIIQQKYEKDANIFLSLYLHQTDQEARNSFNMGWRDEMAWGAHNLARIHTKKSEVKAWLYYFSKVPPGRNSNRYGAFHSAEIVYIFNSFKAVDRPWTRRDKKLGDQMLSYWVNFASTGDPNRDGLPKWPVYDPQLRKVLDFGDRIKTRTILNEDIVQFYNNRLKQQRDP